MGLLSQIVAYTSVMAAMNSIVQVPDAPTLPPPTVLTVESDDSYQIEENPVDVNSVGSHMSGRINNFSSYLSSKEIINGIDISSHQHNSNSNIDIDKVINSGEIKFSFVKATEGTHYINPHFRDDTVKFIENNVPVGFYHYARPSSDIEDAKKQAQFFVKVTGIDQGVKSFPPVLDIEEDEGLDHKELIDWTEAYVNEIKNLTGKDTMIYTYPNFWKTKMNNTTKFNNLPLWIADYNKESSPRKPLIGGWNTWTFWQYTSEETIAGVDSEVDGNVFNGNYTDLLSLYK